MKTLYLEDIKNYQIIMFTKKFNRKSNILLIFKNFSLTHMFLYFEITHDFMTYISTYPILFSFFMAPKLKKMNIHKVNKMKLRELKIFSFVAFKRCFSLLLSYLFLIKCIKKIRMFLSI